MRYTTLAISEVSLKIIKHHQEILQKSNMGRISLGVALNDIVEKFK